MTERLDCPNRPRLCEYPACKDECFPDEDVYRKQEEKVKANPFLYRGKVIMR